MNTCKSVLITCFVALLTVGCGATGDGESKPLKLLGVPQSAAYVGVEYVLEVGADGGEGELNYSLTNAPDWLAMEPVDNPFRSAVILRGIPEITGGASLSETYNVTLSVTDGRNLASVEFDLLVSDVDLERVVATIGEGEVSDLPEDSNTNDTQEQVIESDSEIGKVCMVDEEGQPLFSKQQVNSFVENQMQPQAWNGKRVSLAFLPINLNQVLVQEVLGDFSISGDIIPGKDILSEVQLDNGEVISVTSGKFSIPRSKEDCHLLLFIIDDLDAEKTEAIKIEQTIKNIGLLDVDISETATISINDNEPVASFEVDRLSISEGTLLRTDILLDKPAEQNVRLRLIIDEEKSTTSTQLGSEGDLNIQPDSLEVQIPSGIDRASVVFQVNVDGADENTLDEVLALSLADTETVNADGKDDSLNVYLNEWIDDLLIPLGTEGQLVEARADDRANVFVGFHNEGPEGQVVSYIKHLSRYGSEIGNIELSVPEANVKLSDFWVKRFGEDTEEDDDILELFLLLQVDKQVASVPPSSGFVLGGTDGLVQKYRKINNVGDFQLIWERQLGTQLNDEFNSIVVTDTDVIVVIGTTEGGLQDKSNLGDKDGFLITLDLEGQVIESRQAGTSDADDFLIGNLDGRSRVHVAGTYAENPTSNENLIRLRSYDDSGNLRRDFLFGGDFNVPNGIVSTQPGGVVAGTTNSAVRFSNGFVFKEPESDQLGLNAFLSLHSSLSELTDVELIGGQQDDYAWDIEILDTSVFVVGSTLGTVISGQPGNGNEDWWVARYDIVERSDNDEDEFQKSWLHQGSHELPERAKEIVTTAFGKSFVFIEEESESSKVLRVKPISNFDGVDLNHDCRKVNDNCEFD